MRLLPHLAAAAVIAAVLFASCSMLAPHAMAAPSVRVVTFTPDLSYGVAGEARAHAGTRVSDDALHTILPQADGSAIVHIGGFLAWVKPDGALDPAFGQGGIVLGANRESIQGVAQLSSGRIAVFASDRDSVTSQASTLINLTVKSIGGKDYLYEAPFHGDLSKQQKAYVIRRYALTRFEQNVTRVFLPRIGR
jgi:hypothetical protein